MVSFHHVSTKVAAAAGVDAAIIDQLILGVHGFLETQTGRFLGEPESTSDFVFGLGGLLLQLHDKVESGTPTVVSRAYPGPVETAVTAFEIRQGATSTALARTDGSPWSRGVEYKVTYTRGYPINEGPADLVQLALDLIALRLGQQGHEGMKSESLGGYSYTVADGQELDAIPGARQTIGRWRRTVYA